MGFGSAEESGQDGGGSRSSCSKSSSVVTRLLQTALTAEEGRILQGRAVPNGSLCQMWLYNRTHFFKKPSGSSSKS